MKTLDKWLFATPKEREELGNPFLQMFASSASQDVKAPDGFEDPADRATELEVEAELEEAHQENLRAKAEEQTELIQDQEFRWGELDRQSTK